MLTQGWRRYDTERILRNDAVYSDSLPAKGYSISGVVRTTPLWRPVQNQSVTILSSSSDFSETTVTDQNGRFYLSTGNLVDSTMFLVQVAPREGRNILGMELVLDPIEYPKRTVPVVSSKMPDKEVLDLYANKSEQQYFTEHGFRIINLDEVTITTQRRKGVDYSLQYRRDDVTYSLTEEEIERVPPVSMESLFNKIPALMAKELTGYNFYVDDIHEDADYVMNILHPADVAQVDIVTIGINRNIVFLFTKRGKYERKETPNIKSQTS